MLVWCPCNLSFGALSSAQEVGVGLYLGLAILQIVSTGNLSDLTRRMQILQKAIDQNDLRIVKVKFNTISNELSELDRIFQDFSRKIFVLALLLLAGCLFLVAFTALNSELSVSCQFTYAVLFYLVFLPIVVFVFSAKWMSSRSRVLKNRIRACEEKVNESIRDK